MKIVVITNQKGGVGKTTIATHFAYHLRDRVGARTLFVDLDPQGNSSKTLGEYATGIMASSWFAQRSQAPDVTHQPIDLIQADAAMADLERQPASIINHFAAALDAVAERYDYCVIDTPPTLGLRMSGALIVADYVLAPIELEEYSIDGIVQMLKTIYGVREKYNKKLNFIGMLPNRFNSRSTSQKNTLKALGKDYAHLLLPAPIGFRTAIPEALHQKVPVWALRKTAAREAAKEVDKAMMLIMEKVEA